VHDELVQTSSGIAAVRGGPVTGVSTVPYSGLSSLDAPSHRGTRVTGPPATAAIPDDVVDQLIVHGSPADCRAKLARYEEQGVTNARADDHGLDRRPRRMIRALAPSASA